MSGAVSDTRIRAPFSPDQPYGIFLDGREHPTQERFAAIDPSTGQEWATIPQATTDDVDRAVAAARAAYEGWRRSTPSMRQALLDALADRIEADASSDGFRTTVFPAASAGASLFASVISGEFHGISAAITPSGSRTV